MKYIYVPGCALMCYKPRLAEQLKEVLEAHYGPVETMLSCCFNRPQLEPGTRILTPCTTCAQTYRKHYPDCETIWVLEEMLSWEDFPFPDYGGEEMSVQDTCSGRTDDRYLNTVRALLERMNIRVIEAEKSGKKGRCCGQLLYGRQPMEKVEAYMKGRAAEMPCENVVTYCASCNRAMNIGGRQSRFLLDLMWGEPTQIDDVDIVGWNTSLAKFRATH